MAEALLLNAERMLTNRELTALCMAGLIDYREFLRLRNLINQLVLERERFDHLVRTAALER